MGNLFENPEMRDAVIYEFTNSPYEALIYADSLRFEKGNKTIGLVDQFQGKRPVVLNYDFAVLRKELRLGFIHTLIMDSHIVDALHRFVSGKGKQDEDSKFVVTQFLNHVSQIKCDYNPVFYMVENWAKSPEEVYLKTTSEKLTSLLTLHAMDEEIFLRSGEISLKQEAIDYYFEKYDASSIEECALRWAESLINVNAFDMYKKHTRLTYACLLKMVLIHFLNPEVSEKNIIDKTHQFIKFLVEDLDIMLMREFSLAIYYFSNLAGRFLNIQPNMSYKKAAKNLRATAWDMLLLRLPEMLLEPSRLPEVNTSYIVTSEDKLLAVGELFNLESLFYPNSKSFGTPALSTKSENFDSKISQENLDLLFQELSQLSFIRRQIDYDIKLDDSKVEWIINDLEHQLGHLCRG